MPLKSSLMPETYLPMVIQPDGDSAADRNLSDYVRLNRDEIESRLFQYGALLFRDFYVSGAESLSQTVGAFDGNTLDYFGGSVPRGKIADKIFNATELTRLFKISLHNELAYQKHYPDRVFFYCHEPSRNGGETFIADVRRIYQQMPTEIVKLFEERGVRYVRIYQDFKPLREKIKQYVFFYQHLTWQAAMHADTREEAEERCRALEMNYRWRENGDMEVWNVLPATKLHPVTGEPCWFNQILMQNFNPLTYGKIGYSFRKLMYWNDSDMPNNSYFGDGEPIPRTVIRKIWEVGNRNTIAFPWQKGDVMLLDNHLVAHGRNPFNGGNRKVMVALMQNPEIYGALAKRDAA